MWDTVTGTCLNLTFSNELLIHSWCRISKCQSDLRSCFQMSFGIRDLKSQNLLPSSPTPLNFEKNTEYFRERRHEFEFWTQPYCCDKLLAKFITFCFRLIVSLVDMHIIAASCLRPIAEEAEKENNHLRGNLTTIPGLGLNRHHPNSKQRLQSLLNSDQPLRAKSDLIIWHDIINNTISRHLNPRNDPRKEYPAVDP